MGTNSGRSINYVDAHGHGAAVAHRHNICMEAVAASTHSAAALLGYQGRRGCLGSGARWTSGLTYRKEGEDAETVGRVCTCLHQCGCARLELEFVLKQ
jgi:hypothetical protein